ncbi:MAG: FlgD immunoglobulin-like domain containing protein [bacterium]
MRHTLFLVLFVFPTWLPAQEHSVPAGTVGNQLVLAVENASPSPLQGIRVAIRSAPAWVIFKTNSVMIDSIPSKTWRDAIFEFLVSEQTNDQTAAVMLAITDAHGNFLGSRVIKLRTVLLPRETKLDHPYPNPANPSSTIQYTLHTPSHVKIEIYNTLGQRVRQLIDEDKPAGILSLNWDGRGDQGNPVASGMYIVRLRAAEKETKQVKQFTSKILIQK